MTNTTRSDETISVSNQLARGTSPRRVALEVLLRVEQDDAYANLTLPSVLARADLTGRDAALATELTYGTLRSQGLYDAILQSCARRPLRQIEPALRPVLRMGVHQVLAMRVAEHAAVDQSVKLARGAVGERSVKFVNAVLRAVTQKTVDEWVAELAPQRSATEVERWALQHSHPEWVVRALRESLVASGRPAAEISDLLTANNTAAPVSLALLPGVVGLDDPEITELEAGVWSPVAVRSGAGDPGSNNLVTSGAARVQDEGSQLAALLTAAVPVEGRDEQWADLCSGPGGKTALLAAAGADRDSHVTAFELQEHRADLVRQATTRLADRVTVVTGDGTEVGEDYPGHFDRILVDAPCTGLGALRRRPESRWRREPADLATLTPLQRQLLGSAVKAVRPGGVVVYVTCSPHPAETRLVVGDVLRNHTGIVAEDTTTALEQVARTTIPDATGPHVGTGSGKRSTVQLWPHLHDTDAMFMAILRRVE